jgi:hypothetical protein
MLHYYPNHGPSRYASAPLHWGDFLLYVIPLPTLAIWIASGGDRQAAHAIFFECITVFGQCFDWLASVLLS